MALVLCLRLDLVLCAPMFLALDVGVEALRDSAIRLSVLVVAVVGNDAGVVVVALDGVLPVFPGAC